MKAMVLRSSLFALFWWVLAEGRQDGWMLGAVAVALATWISLKLLPPAAFPLRLARLPGFVAFFVLNSVRGGLQVAGMAWRGPASLQPALIELPLGLPPGAPRILLVNALSLMPGTLGVEMSDTLLRLHVLDRRLPVLDEARALEARIAHLFGSRT